jgi:hypothetical protein
MDRLSQTPVEDMAETQEGYAICMTKSRFGREKHWALIQQETENIVSGHLDKYKYKQFRDLR